MVLVFLLARLLLGSAPSLTFLALLLPTAFLVRAVFLLLNFLLNLRSLTAFRRSLPSRPGGTGVVPGVPPCASPSGCLRKELRTSARSLKTPAHSRNALSAGASSKGPSCWVHRNFSRLSVRQPAHQSRAGLGQPLQLMSFKPTLTGHTSNWLFNPGVGVSCNYIYIHIQYVYIYICMVYRHILYKRTFYISHFTIAWFPNCCSRKVSRY